MLQVRLLQEREERRAQVRLEMSTNVYKCVLVLLYAAIYVSVYYCVCVRIEGWEEQEL